MDSPNGIRLVLNRLTLVLTLTGAVLPAALAQDAADLSGLTLESLRNTQITSVSRHLEELRSTAAAAYVITREDIRRSGVLDLPDLLRMVPGVDVAQITASTWAVSVRGFNAQYANKLLVLVDGRTVYDPSFSGVLWHLQSMSLEDIERIEVIRGPGATMWGANAVNGVVNITTRRAAETPGGMFVAGAGSDRPGEGSVRYGGSVGRRGFYRVFGKQTTSSGFTTDSGSSRGDSSNTTSTGFRMDWTLSNRDSVTVDAEGYRSVRGIDLKTLSSLSPIQYQPAGAQGSTGGHVLARWSRSVSATSAWSLQFAYDRAHHTDFRARDVSIVDFDLQQNFSIGSRNNVIWGIGQRNTGDEFENYQFFYVNPAARRTALTSGFVQDEISLIPHELSLTAGAKYEYSSFTKSDVQPTVSLSWTPSARQSAWLSIARAVRTPNRLERGLVANTSTFTAGPKTGLVNVYGRENARSEGLRAHEAGYRYQANRRLFVDIATFYNVYDHLGALEAGATFLETTPGPPHLVMPLYRGNWMKRETYGAEAAVDYRVIRVSVQGRIQPAPDGVARAERRGPRRREGRGRKPAEPVLRGVVSDVAEIFRSFRSGLLRGFAAYARDSCLHAAGFECDMEGRRNIELSIAGSNLLGRHPEFQEVLGSINPVGRRLYAKLIWLF